jgi:hypothetical protein
MNLAFKERLHIIRTWCVMWPNTSRKQYLYAVLVDFLIWMVPSCKPVITSGSSGCRQRALSWFPSPSIILTGHSVARSQILLAKNVKQKMSTHHRNRTHCSIRKAICNTLAAPSDEPAIRNCWLSLEKYWRQRTPSVCPCNVMLHVAESMPQICKYKHSTLKFKTQTSQNTGLIVGPCKEVPWLCGPRTHLQIYCCPWGRTLLVWLCCSALECLNAFPALLPGP